MNAKYVRSRLTSGFSLIELMVVIAIVALLTAIAVPSYKNYLAQAKVAEIFSLASDQMSKYQHNLNMGSAFDVVSTNLGNYIETAEITGNGGTPTAGGADGTVYIVLNTDTSTGAGSIDPALSGLEITFTATEQGSVTGDTTNTTTGWVCTFDHASTTDVATVTSLLSPGDCT